jgi:predicted nucleic acid-binding protein
MRMRLLDPVDWTKARHLASRLADTWSLIQPTDVVRTRAMQIIEHYDLRAADALQLAAAFEWCQDAPQGRVLLTADERLLQAATLAGFAAARV